MPRQRNYVNRSALMRKGGPHIKSKTGQRVRSRLAISDALHESDIEDEQEFSTDKNENGEPEAEAYIYGINSHKVPKTPDFCSQVVYWREMILPVVDLNKLIGSTLSINIANTYAKHLFLLSYQKEANTPLDYMAFRLSSAPDKIQVNDDDACDLPNEYPEKLTPYTLSLFNYKNQITSIFDIAQLSSN